MPSWARYCHLSTVHPGALTLRATGCQLPLSARGLSIQAWHRLEPGLGMHGALPSSGWELTGWALPCSGPEPEPRALGGPAGVLGQVE